MDHSSDNENSYIYDDDNEDYGIGTTDDLIPDDETNQIFDEKLDENVPENIPDTQNQFEDDEKDSGIAENENESQSDQTVPIAPSLIQGRGRGRGCGHREKSRENEIIVDERGSEEPITDISLPVHGRGRGRARLRKTVLEPPIPFISSRENKTTDDARKSEEPVEIIPSPVRGRGREGRVAVNDNNQPLPPPCIECVDTKDYYPPSPKIAKLPPSYHRKREDPEVKEQRRAANAAKPALIDFSATFSQFSIIIDQDDFDKKGFEHACRRLQEIQPDTQIDFTKPQHDIWSFGLYVYPIELKTPITCNLLDIMPQETNNEDKRPYWFLFKQPPKFVKDSLAKKIVKDSTKKALSLRIGLGIHADLSSGALITINHFHYPKEDTFRKRFRWGLRIYDEFFEIHSNQYPVTNDGTKKPLLQVRHRISLDLIDRAAVFNPWKRGFSLYLNMKGNIHVLHREQIPEQTNIKDFPPFIRQGMQKNQPKPSFSTIRLRFNVKGDDQLSDLLEREGKTTPKTSPDEREEQIKLRREESLEEIREAFKGLLDFFYKNRIHVCFAPIKPREMWIGQTNELGSQYFERFIPAYSWAMLCHTNYRLQVKLSKSKPFIDKLHAYSNTRLDNEKDDEQMDDRFYRLCLYIHRRASEYFFLDLNKEIEIGISLLTLKYERAKEQRSSMPKFTQVSESAAYVPSVVITPTTIKIRPLKLCKLNRVLREKRFGGCFNFTLVELRDEAQRLLFATEFRALKEQIRHFITKGFILTPKRNYLYLHHSQSQVKCKQFWFYFHDREKNYLSHEDAYIWMGNFDQERVVAKHTARIALCFTSTEAAIQIPAEMVTYIRDIQDPKGYYTFSDGVGTISSQLRDQIQEKIKHHYSFSVLQIRYGGCKGTLSVNPDLDDQRHQLVIRDSMNKFTSDHDILELCKLSAPRELHLNRQDIVLLESRGIPHTNFLDFQNTEHFWLVRALLKSSIAYELLQEKLLPVFQLKNIALRMNIVEEHFFIKLIITCAFNMIRELIDRTRIRVPKDKARNMFGIMDEYGVLESGQIFIQYTGAKTNELPTLKEEEQEGEERGHANQCKVYTGKVVVTKNPCHHPGDLRVFDAVYHQRLAHLKDVIVFPQKGDRPHSNEISGSDLDGDEYVVIWHEDLIPTTKNEDPYNYDSQKSIKLERPITRADINQVVMEISEQDCLGTLSNIHLAYVDKEKDGIKSQVCMDLAGAISQEVDAAKTGKHPLTEEDIKKLREGLENKYPDFMRTNNKREYYKSERALGKLYRSARRAFTGWSRAISNHGNAYHIQLALSLINSTEGENEIDQLTNPSICNIPLDPAIHHKDYEKYLPDIKQLYHVYQSELLEIINLYRFHDEIDLFCRSDSMDASAGGSKKNGLEDSAAMEVKKLVERIQQDFYHEFNQKRRKCPDCKLEQWVFHGRIRKKVIDCDSCQEQKMAKAACAYIHSYEKSNKLPANSHRRILSFPWLFAPHLLRLRELNNQNRTLPPTKTLIVGRACQSYLKNLVPKFRVVISAHFNQAEFFYVQTNIDKREEDKKKTIPFVSILRAWFVEILNDWLIKQKIFGEECIETNAKPLVPESLWHELLVYFLSHEYQSNIRLLTEESTPEKNSRILKKWTEDEQFELNDMFEEVHTLAAKKAAETKSTLWSYLDEYIILALQCIAIEKQFVDKWI